MFQSTHPHGVRLRLQIYQIITIWFQSTHPHGVRHAGFNPLATISEFQSTHPHGVRPEGIKAQNDLVNVSIHAPTRGATQTFTLPPLSASVSIHAPTRGATKARVVKLPLRFSFNPRTHTGCDQRQQYSRERYGCFNPRTHTGCDPLIALPIPLSRVSIHAPTRGATRKAAYVIAKATLFQSTHPHGVRPSDVSDFANWLTVSIHAPTRGATDITFKALSKDEVSIHAPTRGATCAV